MQEVATLQKMTSLDYIVYSTNSKVFHFRNKQCLYLNADPDTNANAEMSMPRFPNGRSFPANIAKFLRTAFFIEHL